MPLPADGSNANVGSVSMVDGCVCYGALRQHAYLLEGVKVNSAAIWKKTMNDYLLNIMISPRRPFFPFSSVAQKVFIS